MLIDPDRMPPHHFYQHLSRAVIPRPIGWVSTVSADGRVNLAPYSFFNAVSSNPPCVIFASTADRHGEQKDSLRNVEEIGEFVCNIVSHDVAEKMNQTSASLPRGRSEFDFAGLTPTPSDRVRPPRCQEARVHLECVVTQIVPIGDGPLSAKVVIGRVVLMNVDDAVLDGERMIDPDLLDPVGRLGGDAYTRVKAGRFEMQRPG